eukprot:7353317-Pyramimonas_sp.AAC.1
MRGLITCAGLDYSIMNTKHGYQITVAGYSHKLMTLLQRVLDAIVAFKVDPDRFSSVKEKVAKDYKNVRCVASLASWSYPTSSTSRFRPPSENPDVLSPHLTKVTRRFL